MESDPVAILMTVKDGGRYLPEQLTSLAGQSHTKWTLLAADDGSSDNSRQILLESSTNENPVQLIERPQQGHSTNMLFMLSNLQDYVQSGSWVALCDQDDVWLPDRLSRGINALKTIETPALFCSGTIIADIDLKNRRVSRTHNKQPSFENALVQNIASGNTILLNPAAVEMICCAAKEIKNVVAPDWWMYQLISGSDGQVVYDPEPTLIYRQHGKNQFGENQSLAAKAKRFSMIFRGEYRDWNESNIAALKTCRSFLNNVSIRSLDEFESLRAGPPLSRPIKLYRSGIHRQTLSGTLALWIATTVGWV